MTHRPAVAKKKADTTIHRWKRGRLAHKAALGKREMTTQTNLGKEDEMFLHGECIKENVVLRTQAQILPDAVNVGTYVLVVDVGCA